MFPFFWGEYLEVELLVYMVSICLKTIFSRPVFITVIEGNGVRDDDSKAIP